MKTTRKVIGCVFLTLAAICICSQSTFAQQAKGDKELLFNGSATFTVGVEGGNSQTAQATIGLGYFATSRQEIGGGTTLIVAHGGGASFTAVAPNAFYRYNFGKDGTKTFPYFGVEGGVFVLTGDVSSHDGYVRPNFGFKHFFKKNAAFDFNTGYSRTFGEGGMSQIDLRVGLAFIF